MKFYPSAEQLAEEIRNSPDNNVKLFETRRSVRSIVSHMILFFCASIIVVLLNIFFPDANLLGYFTTGFHLSIRWLSIIPILFLLEGFRQYHDDLYTFSLHNLTHYDGRLSLNYSIPDVRYVDIRAVVVYQDLLGRILDYGDIEVDTAAQEKTELYIEGVRAPSELAELIENMREISKKTALKNNPNLNAKDISQD